MAKKARSAAYKKSYASGKANAIKKGIYVSKALKREIKAIAKTATETVAEKKEMGAASGIYPIDKLMTNVFPILPPTYLGLQAFQRVGAHIKCHSLKLKVQGYIELAADVVKYYPNGVFIDIRVFSVKGLKSAQAVSNGSVTGLINNALDEYKYNIQNTQSSGAGTINQYSRVDGFFADEFAKVNEELITEHYKTSILCETYYSPATNNDSLWGGRVQQQKGSFVKYINIAPFIAKQWKYEPEAFGGTPIQTAASYPNNVAIFCTVTYRNPVIDNSNTPVLMGNYQYATMGTFSDV